MNDAPNWLLHDHRKYEEILSACKSAAERGDWRRAESEITDLISLLKGHFLMEEQVLFPAYEELIGAPRSPTRNLQRDHDLIRQMIKGLTEAIRGEDDTGFAETITSIEELMSQHHEKEEEVFLPMAGHTLLERREQVMERLKRYDWRGAMKSWNA